VINIIESGVKYHNPPPLNGYQMQITSHFCFGQDKQFIDRYLVVLNCQEIKG
jgi:hypothetical protein